MCPLFGNIWVNVIIYDKEKAPPFDGAFLQRNMVLFSSRGREIRTPDLLLPKQALIDQITVDKSKVFFICVPNFRVPKPRFHWFVGN